MLKGVLVGFGIMLAAIPIPIVHFIAVPLSPFIAGFIGSGVAKIDQNGIVKFGGLMAGLMVIPATASTREIPLWSRRDNRSSGINVCGSRAGADSVHLVRCHGWGVGQLHGQSKPGRQSCLAGLRRDISAARLSQGTVKPNG